MIKCHVCDFETASAVDLKLVGAWAYAEHPTTEVLCLSFEGTDRRLTWIPVPGDWDAWRIINSHLRALIADPNVMFVSHGDFERAIWRKIMVPVFGFPDIPNDRWHDTMAVAAMKQLPLELDLLTRVLQLADRKDKEGSALTKSLSKFHKKTGALLVERTPEVMNRVYGYCEHDIASERGVFDRIGFLQRGERKVWLLDQTINQRGVKIDLDYVRACQRVVDGATTPLAAEFREITGGLEFTQVAKVTDWVRGQGVPIPGLGKEIVAEYIGHGFDEPDDDGAASDDGVRDRSRQLPDTVRRALQIRQLVGSASIKKLGRMAACVSANSRALGLLQYHRAGPGRWAGRLLQPQNFPRPSLKYEDTGKGVGVDAVVGALMTGDHEYVAMTVGPPVETVVQGLRHALVPEKGKLFLSGDFAQIEARVVLALAGQHDKCQVFITGKPYIDMAEKIYGRKISKEDDIAEYTIGKNTVLGCGFQMGWRKFNARYCPNQPEEFAQRVIEIYRKEWAPLVPAVWRGLESAALHAVRDRQPTEAYGVLYALEDGWLTARLPSGRKLYYWSPQPEEKEMPWSTEEKPDIRDAWSYEALKTGQWRSNSAFGGLLTENVVQGLARDLLVHAMFLLEENGFPIVLTVHDEALAEVPVAQADELAYRQIMCETPDWAKAIGVPVAAETWIGDRYRK